MANLPEVDNFDAGVYQLEITDPLEGGSGGILNAALKNLTNRTRYLKNLLDNIKFLLFLRKGTVNVPDFSADAIITVSFTNIGTSSYMVNGSLVSKGSNYNDDNDIIWSVKNKTATSFQLCLHETTGSVSSNDFDYVLIPF